MYPMTMLNVAVNYREHDSEMARRSAAEAGAACAHGDALPGTTSAPGIWDAQAGRHALESRTCS